MPLDSEAGDSAPPLLLAIRSMLGGVLMGLANLVPGISGGTMLLASGVYPRFIRAVAEVTTLRFRFRSLLVLGCVVLAAGLAVLLLAGVIKDLVVHHRWIMYSLFIGLTLGGVPVVWRMARPVTATVWVGAAVGFVVMAALALAQGEGATGTEGGGTFVLHGLAGVAGASAMILPGVSGGYLLLVLGEYIPILSAVDAFKDALQARDLAAAMSPALEVLLPVGIGVVVGVVAVSNLLKWLLIHREKATLGVLLGLLVGAVVGLWPFQQPAEPIPGVTIVKGVLVTEDNFGDLEVEDYPTERFHPSGGQIAGSLGLILLGAATTLGVAHFGRDDDSDSATS